MEDAPYPPPEHTAWSTPPPTDEAHRSPPSETLLPDAQPLAGPGEEPGAQQASQYSARPSARMIATSVLLALVGFVIGATLLHGLLSHPLYLHADARSGKMQIMQEWQGRAWSAAFGSSHVHNGFDPRSFDAALAGTPLATRSLNLAVVGGSQTEQRTMAIEFLHHLKPPPPDQPAACFVLLELTAGANFTNNHLVHPRAINIYDFDTIRFDSKLTAPDMPRTRRLGRIGFAVAAGLLHYMNLGMLSNRLLPPPTPDSLYKTETAEDRRGVLTMDPTPAVERDILDRIAHLPAHTQATNGELFPGTSALIADLQRAASIHGVQFVYVTLPKFADRKEEALYPPFLTVNGQQVPIVNLAQPDRYPELYRSENWLDDSHLDSQGAALAARLIAQALLSFYAAHPQPQTCGA